MVRPLGWVMAVPTYVAVSSISQSIIDLFCGKLKAFMGLNAILSGE